MATKEKNTGLLLASIVIIVLLDFGTKHCAKATLFGQETKSFLNGFFTLLYMENSGAMLSIGATLSDSARGFIFIGLIAACLLLWTIYLITRSSNKSSILYSSFIIGGGFGNLLSRLLNNGNVVDFMYLDVGIVSTGVFNIADISILLGLVLLIIQQSKTNNANGSINNTHR